MKLNRLIEWAHACLLDSEEAQAYLLGRGVSRDQWERHNVGFIGGQYSPDPQEDVNHNDKCLDKDHKHLWCDTCRYISWSTKWVKVKEEDTRKTAFPGLRIKDNIVLPLTSYSGSVVGIQTRSIVEKAYDTFAIRRRPEGYFFGISSSISTIWSRRVVFLTEGPFDDLILERLVTPNVLALTTSSPGKLQISFIKRYVDSVYSCLDRDSAGRDGLQALLKYLPGKNVIDVDFPKIRQNDKDLSDFWARVGDDKFKSYFQDKLGAIL